MSTSINQHQPSADTLCTNATAPVLAKVSTRAMVQALAANDADFEWYPTTNEIIACIRHDMGENTKLDKHPSVLDCGAGDARVLCALTEGDAYAIEKAKPLIETMPKRVFIVGTEFTEQTLLDKKVDVVFSNPPYSEFVQWAIKIIQEANAQYIYLVLPQRWQDNADIAHALEERDASSEVIGEFDFLSAERQARAKVHVIRVTLCISNQYYSRGPKTDPFRLWFERHFHLEINNAERSKSDIFNKTKANMRTSLESALVPGSDLVAVLQALYQRDLDALISTYKKLEDIDPQLMEELNVNMDGLRAALQQKIEGLKDIYWHELFDRLDKITERLTKKSRGQLLGKLTAHTHVDFSAKNAYAVVIWVIKNANAYYDDQIIQVVETMTEKANVQLYTSNTRTFGQEHWRYCRTPEALSHYKLDYRIVLARCGGLSNDSYWGNRTQSGLSERAGDLINDLRTVATNLGFDASAYRGAHNFTWESNKKNVFHARDLRSGDLIALFEVKAFKNGNLHIKFNQAFMCRLNVEFGRLKGWVKSKKDAAQELNIPLEECADHFDSNHRISSADSSILRISS